MYGVRVEIADCVLRIADLTRKAGREQMAAGRRQKKDGGLFVSCPWSVARKAKGMKK
jgi:hypothetical protein